MNTYYSVELNGDFGQQTLQGKAGPVVFAGTRVSRDDVKLTTITFRAHEAQSVVDQLAEQGVRAKEEPKAEVGRIAMPLAGACVVDPQPYGGNAITLGYTQGLNPLTLEMPLELAAEIDRQFWKAGLADIVGPGKDETSRCENCEHFRGPWGNRANLCGRELIHKRLVIGPCEHFLSRTEPPLDPSNVPQTPDPASQNSDPASASGPQTIQYPSGNRLRTRVAGCEREIGEVGHLAGRVQGQANDLLRRIEAIEKRHK